MLAIAERAWRGGGTEYFDGLGTILPPEDTEAFKEFADFEKRMLWHKAVSYTHLNELFEYNLWNGNNDLFPQADYLGKFYNCLLYTSRCV